VATSVEPIRRTCPTVFAVLVTFNGRESLEQAIARRDAQTRRPDAVLAVDNVSADGAKSFLETQKGNVSSRFRDERINVFADSNEATMARFGRRQDHPPFADEVIRVGDAGSA
jgi:hypothetical protein